MLFWHKIHKTVSIRPSNYLVRDWSKMPKSMKESYEYSLIDHNGRRKYLNIDERRRYYDCLDHLGQERRLFCQLLYWSGMRISEALYIKGKHLDLSEQVVIIRSLKKRGKISFRQIPLPNSFLSEVKTLEIDDEYRIWNFSRSTASRLIRHVMDSAAIEGTKACARGLRHSFAVNAISHNIPLTLIQKWMGHASLTTTAIYLNILGAEERGFAERMWKT